MDARNMRRDYSARSLPTSAGTPGVTDTHVSLVCMHMHVPRIHAQHTHVRTRGRGRPVGGSAHARVHTHTHTPTHVTPTRSRPTVHPRRAHWCTRVKNDGEHARACTLHTHTPTHVSRRFVAPAATPPPIYPRGFARFHSYTRDKRYILVLHYTADERTNERAERNSSVHGVARITTGLAVGERRTTYPQQSPRRVFQRGGSASSSSSSSSSSFWCTSRVTSRSVANTTVTR